MKIYFLNKENNSIKSGFTIAEVLITLAIIGIVATLTIPGLISNYQKTVWATQLKKDYILVNQALIELADDYGCNGDLKCTQLFDENTSYNKFGDEFVKYFKVSKNCRTDHTNCFSDAVIMCIDGSESCSPKQNWNVAGYQFITLDGSAIQTQVYNWNCRQYSSITSGNLSQWCGNLDIDVNGPKGPNILGRDIFSFYITNGKGPAIYPENGNEAGGWQAGGCGYTRNGYTYLYGQPCAARIMDEDWQMKY